jgi:hypothetical protein
LTPEQKEANNAWRTARRNVWYEEINKLKLGLGCQYPDCRNIIDIPAQLEFAHISQEDKEFDIGVFLNYSPYVSANRERLEAEIAKCRVLCIMHHRLETVQGGHSAVRRNKREALGVLACTTESPGLQRACANHSGNHLNHQVPRR